MELINNNGRHDPIKSALFDFDGTISLIREGWQGIMTPYFAEELTKVARDETPEECYAVAREFIEELTGKDTIFQCMQLAEEIKKRGGTPLEPLAYKKEYLRRLWEKIEDRVAGLKNKELRPLDYVLEGSFRLLDELLARDVKMYLASGTDHPYVVAEAQLLGVDKYFEDRIFGALDDWTVRSKATVIQHILKTHNLSGSSLVTFGDGFVEIECCRAVGGIAIGVASDESNPGALNEWKRERLIRAGADIIITDFSELDAVLDYLFGN